MRSPVRWVTTPDWIEFTDATQVAQLRRTVTTNGKKTVEVVYLTTSADPHAAPPATLAASVQGHGSIENALHWVRDVTYDEDRHRPRPGPQRQGPPASMNSPCQEFWVQATLATCKCVTPERAELWLARSRQLLPIYDIFIRTHR